MRVVTGNSRQPTEAPVVAAGSGLSVVGLQQADHIFVNVPPAAGSIAMRAKVRGQIMGIDSEARHGKVTGQDVVERWDISRALNRGVSTQCHDPATRTTD